LVVPDAYDPNFLTPTVSGTQPRAYGKTITVNGQKHVIEASSEQELLAKENEIMRAAFTSQAEGYFLIRVRGTLTYAQSAKSQPSNLPLRYSRDDAARFCTGETAATTTPEWRRLYASSKSDNRV